MESFDAAPAGSTSGPRYSARDVLSAPGLLSLSRLPLAALFPFVFRSSGAAVAVLLAAAVTDVLDGWLARRLRQETATGAVLDGFMDKLLALVVLFTLVFGRELSVRDALVLSTREVCEALIVVCTLALRPRRAASLHPANTLGKLATTLEFMTVLVVVLRSGPRELLVLATGLCGGAAAVAYGFRELRDRPA